MRVRPHLMPANFLCSLRNSNWWLMLYFYFSPHHQLCCCWIVQNINCAENHQEIIFRNVGNIPTTRWWWFEISHWIIAVDDRLDLTSIAVRLYEIMFRIYCVAHILIVFQKKKKKNQRIKCCNQHEVEFNFHSSILGRALNGAKSNKHRAARRSSGINRQLSSVGIHEHWVRAQSIQRFNWKIIDHYYVVECLSCSTKLLQLSKWIWRECLEFLSSNSLHCLLPLCCIFFFSL